MNQLCRPSQHDLLWKQQRRLLWLRFYRPPSATYGIGVANRTGDCFLSSSASSSSDALKSKMTTTATTTTTTTATATATTTKKKKKRKVKSPPAETVRSRLRRFPESNEVSSLTVTPLQWLSGVRGMRRQSSNVMDQAADRIYWFRENLFRIWNPDYRIGLGDTKPDPANTMPKLVMDERWWFWNIVVGATPTFLVILYCENFGKYQLYSYRAMQTKQQLQQLVDQGYIEQEDADRQYQETLRKQLTMTNFDPPDSRPPPEQKDYILEIIHQNIRFAFRYATYYAALLFVDTKNNHIPPPPTFKDAALPPPQTAQNTQPVVEYLHYKEYEIIPTIRRNLRKYYTMAQEYLKPHEQQTTDTDHSITAPVQQQKQSQTHLSIAAPQQQQQQLQNQQQTNESIPRQEVSRSSTPEDRSSRTAAAAGQQQSQELSLEQIAARLQALEELLETQETHHVKRTEWEKQKIMRQSPIQNRNEDQIRKFWQERIEQQQQQPPIAQQQQLTPQQQEQQPSLPPPQTLEEQRVQAAYEFLRDPSLVNGAKLSWAIAQEKLDTAQLKAREWVQTWQQQQEETPQQHSNTTTPGMEKSNPDPKTTTIQDNKDKEIVQPIMTTPVTSISHETLSNLDTTPENDRTTATTIPENDRTTATTIPENDRTTATNIPENDRTDTNKATVLGGIRRNLPQWLGGGISSSNNNNNNNSKNHSKSQEYSETPPSQQA